jgi:hypothetical protein
MADVQALIAAERALLSTIPFLRALEGPGTAEQIRRVVPRLAFFVLGFQDVLRLASEKTSDPALKPMSEEHRAEDLGHDLWYLHDLAKLEAERDVRWLFSSEHQLARDVAYSQIADVLTATDDRTRVAVVLSLEAIGAEFFGRAIAFLDRTRGSHDLTYFARKHQQIESSHQVFEDDKQSALDAVTVSATAWAEARRAVENTFAGMTRLGADLHAAFVGTT